jgi:GxxExxY protein
MVELLLKEEVYAIVGAAIEVHRELGPGFTEPVCQEAMEIEMSDRGLPFLAQSELRICYKGRTLKKRFVPDFVCYGKVVVELKAIDRLSGADEAQLLNYLKASGLRVSLLINFGSHPTLEWKRFVR